MIVAYAGRNTARHSFDAARLTLFPSRVVLSVTPGNVRLTSGSPLTIEARLVGNTTPLIAQLLQADGNAREWNRTDMQTDASGRFHVGLDAVASSFRYRVAAGAVTSPIYEVTVSRAPRVARIDVEYRYPPELGIQPRTEEDSGDIYAPAGTDVHVRVLTDIPAVNGQMALADGKAIPLSLDSPTELSASLKIVSDNSYRVALADREGLKSAGDTEYFIRTLADRPPDVHIVKPARDRTVTSLEEVDIQARAEDDYGIDRLDLIYSVRGGPEKAIPLSVPRSATSVEAAHTLYLEDLDVKPGDFVSYYVKARDRTRGTRPNETRSDIFFLEVKPFEQDFVLAHNQSSGAGTKSLDDLVAAQKDVVVATWKLDRRAEAASGVKSEPDIRAVGRAETELKARVEETASSFRNSAMRDPRRPGRSEAPPAGQTLPEEDAMTAAVAAMGKAVASLDALKTSDALPPELQALDALLKAQGVVRKREVGNQQASSGATASNRTNVDMSSLFDKELQRQQQTNYEAPSIDPQRDQPNSTLDKIRDLARRQDELNRQQQELAQQRDRMSPEELKRDLEKLTREQSDLRQRAEDLARQMNEQRRSGQDQSGQQSASQQSASQQGQSQSPNGTQNGAGQPSQSGQAGGAGQRRESGQQTSGQQASSGRQGQGTGGGEQQMRDISEEMRNAASELRRQDPAQASARGARALERLQSLERQMQTATPDEGRRAVGELQLEARQLAESERQGASTLGKLGQGDAAKDALRRLAGEQERLADRARRMEDALKQIASGAQGAGSGKDTQADRQRAAADAARDLERQRLAERMQEAAEQLRSASGGDSARTDPGKAKEQAAKAASTEQNVAQSFERIADALGAAQGSGDDSSGKLADQRRRAQGLQQEIDRLTGELEKLSQQAQSSSGQSARKSPGDTGQQGRGRAGGGEGGVAQLREQYAEQLQKTRELMNELQHDDPTFAQGGAGFTFEGQGMTLSAPGTEAFKQDFAKWQQLRQQATQALDRAQTALSKKLQAKEARDRLAAGADERPPAGYESQVDSYFKALAKKKQE
jgi:hypothetical protein